MSAISSKFSNLEKAQNAGLATPKTLLLNKTSKVEITHFINSCQSDSLFIVRSIQNCEDGDGLSYAGHFWSSAAIKTNQIEETINLAIKNNQEILHQLNSTEKPLLMLQEFIQHSVGGVLFSPWSFFSEYCYIEYSTKSVQQAVEGLVEPAILSLDNNQPSPLALPDDLHYLIKPLQKITQKLRGVFKFPIDCEWAYCKKRQEIIVLQVRPQTSLVASVLGKPDDNSLPPLPLGDWQYTALSESLGRLSPLSYSLLLKLYEASKSNFQSLGYKAEQVNFMLRLPDGSILTDSQREKQFYSSTRMGGFWRGFRAPQWQQKANDFLTTVKLEDKFSYSQLSQLFQFWMLSNLLSQGKGREQTPLTHAYELTWQQSQGKPNTSNDKKSWNQLNPMLRDLFFYELEKLKKRLSESSKQVFSSWDEYKNQTLENDILIQRQYDDAPLALYDYSILGTDNNSPTMQSIGAKKNVSGNLFFIDKPSQFRQEIPDDCILITPYFNNQWVHDIKRIKAIIVERGGQLSHSAIVARECDIPYFISDSKLLEQFKQGDTVNLNTSGLLSYIKGNSK